jgi:hypothetical protein
MDGGGEERYPTDTTSEGSHRGKREVFNRYLLSAYAYVAHPPFLSHFLQLPQLLSFSLSSSSSPSNNFNFFPQSSRAK